MFRLLSLCCRHLCNLTSPPTSSEQFSQGYLRSCLPGLSPKNLHQIKHNSQKKKKKTYLSTFRLWLFFKSTPLKGSSKYTVVWLLPGTHSNLCSAGCTRTLGTSVHCTPRVGEGGCALLVSAAACWPLSSGNFSEAQRSGILSMVSMGGLVWLRNLLQALESPRRTWMKSLHNCTKEAWD